MSQDFVIQNQVWNFNVSQEGQIVEAKNQSENVSVSYNRTSSNFSVDDTSKDYTFPIGVLLKMLSLSSTEMGVTL
jgi:hypothetical protein